MSRFLSEVEAEVQDVTRRFSRSVIRPRRLESYETEQCENFHRELTKHIGDLGLIGALIPEACGGVGLTTTGGCVILEELGRESRC